MSDTNMNSQGVQNSSAPNEEGKMNTKIPTINITDEEVPVTHM